MRSIEACRTASLGGHMDVCADCGHQRPSYNSCRNRHCPKCQALSAARWLEQRRQRLLPVHYFHVVFTVPRELRGVALRNRRRFYTLLMRAAGQTLLTLGRDPNRLNALLGVTAVLHTWTRELRFHPHVHCIVTGGGLDLSKADWVHTGPNYLFPVKVLAQVFRGKLLKALATAHERQPLRLPDTLASAAAFAQLRAKLCNKDWCVYAKRPFAGPQQVFTYLGQYTHRVAISNHRIRDVADAAVVIATRNGGTATMAPLEFIRRFVLHILPKGFVKIRHYGLVASSNVNTRLLDARHQLGQPPRDTEADPPVAIGWRELFVALTGIDLNVCQVCGSRNIQPVPLAAAYHQPLVRAPPRS